MHSGEVAGSHRGRGGREDDMSRGGEVKASSLGDGNPRARPHSKVINPVLFFSSSLRQNYPICANIDRHRFRAFLLVCLQCVAGQRQRVLLPSL